MEEKGPQIIDPARSPRLVVPVSLILAGIVGLLLLQPLLLLKAPILFRDFRYNQVTLAAVHLFTLGFATTVMLGAYYQIAPVMMLGRPVDWRWALGQGGAHVIGSALLVVGFYQYEGPWITWGGTLVVLSLLLFMGLILFAMRTSTQWTISGTYMAASLGFLAATILWGLTLAFNLRYNFLGQAYNHAPLGAHLVVGLGGWFMLTIFGVTYQLVPMFALSQRVKSSRPKIALALLITGFSAAFLSLTFGLAALVTGLSLLPVLAGIGLYAADLSSILHQRRRPELDLSMRYAMTAFGFLALSLPLMAIGTYHEQVAVPAVWLFLAGFVSCMILGMLYKILPFLIWHHLLKTRKHKHQKLPMLTQMYHPGLAEAGYWSWVGGVLLTGLILLLGGFGEAALAAELVQFTLPLNLIGSLLFALTILQVLRSKPLT